MGSGKWEAVKRELGIGNGQPVQMPWVTDVRRWAEIDESTERDQKRVGPTLLLVIPTEAEGSGR